MGGGEEREEEEEEEEEEGGEGKGRRDSQWLNKWLDTCECRSMIDHVEMRNQLTITL
jgi:hypothetical protein